MEPNAFVAEVYRRMASRHKADCATPNWKEMEDNPIVMEASQQYRSMLPDKKDASILDIGFGNGWFIAACIKLDYKNICGADFGAKVKSYIKDWSSSVREIYDIETNIGDFLANHRESYDFIHLSHVIEHIPKYSLFFVVDALYFALKKGGTLLVRTPNMEGPCSSSSMYVTLGHEYGYCGSNIVSLLSLCNFEEIKLHKFKIYDPTIKQRIGLLLRWFFIQWNAIRHRLFGVNLGGIFEKELIVTAKRGTLPPLFDEKYK